MENNLSSILNNINKEHGIYLIASENDYKHNGSNENIKLNIDSTLTDGTTLYVNMSESEYTVTFLWDQLNIFATNFDNVEFIVNDIKSKLIFDNVKTFKYIGVPDETITILRCVPVDKLS